MNQPTLPGEAHLRVARPTDQLDAAVAFYRDGLGMQSLGAFSGHDGFDGVMLGHKGAGFHLELTHHRGHLVGKAPTKDNLLVFYMPDSESWAAAIAMLENAGHRAVPSYNPFWDKCGKTFEDPDGYRVVLVQGEFKVW